MTARPGPLTRDCDFLRLGTAETVSQFGSQVSTLAIPLIAATILVHETIWVAAVGLAFPWLFVALGPVREIRTIPTTPAAESA